MSTPDRGSATVAETVAFEQLAAVTLSDPSLHSVLQTVADLTSQVMRGDIQASVTTLLSDRPMTAVYTGQLALDLDESQYACGHGPCLHAAGTGDTVQVDDARTEQRWTDYMRHAVACGSLSSLSISLGGGSVGAALNSYSRAPAAFGEDRVRVGHRFARFAGIAVANMYVFQSSEERADNVRAAMESRAIIDEAKGILVERYGSTPDQAFTLLAETSMATDRKLRDVAAHLVSTGELTPTLNT